MTWRDRIIATIAIVFAGACGALGVWSAGRPLPQQYPRGIIYYGNQPTYFWDSRTDLCFAFVRSRNLYGDIDSITNVPCTAEVKKAINSK
jgi:hypothetical protein